jgi:hypothetical protein
MWNYHENIWIVLYVVTCYVIFLTNLYAPTLTTYLPTLPTYDIPTYFVLFNRPMNEFVEIQ